MQYFQNQARSIRCYDLSARLNVHSLRPDFHRIKGAHVGMFHVKSNEGNIWAGPSESIYNDLVILPGHGQAAMQRAMQFFVFQNCPNTTHLYVKAQRARCPEGGMSAKVYGLVDHGTQHAFQHVGILCVSRENVLGGSFQWSTGDFAQLRPGDMAIYDTNQANLEVTNISCATDAECYVDFLVFFGNC